VGPTAIALVFVIIWWIVWFMALPFGVRPPAKPEPGHTPSAPEKPMLVRKALITTAIAAVIVGAIVAIVEVGWLSLEDFAE
jgi:predicted secreted protein